MLNNENVVYTIMVIFMVLYSKLARPILPTVIKKNLQSDIGRILLLALIAYQSNKDIKLSVLMSIGYIIIMDLVSHEEIEESYKNLATGLSGLNF